MRKSFREVRRVGRTLCLVSDLSYFWIVFVALRYLLRVSKNLTFLLSGSLICAGFALLNPTRTFFPSWLSKKPLR